MSDTASAFPYKEIDPEGFETLKVISDAVHFNDWTYETVRPFCSGSILEIGSGIGNISSRFIQNGYDITLSDIRQNYREFLAARFPGHAREGKIIGIDLVDPDFNTRHASLAGKFDTVFALNVVEHIRDDEEAISNCAFLLTPGGSLIILVPAFPALYNSFDRELHHFRRYRKKELNNLFGKAGIQVEHSFYFNAGGIPGWFWSGNVQKNKIIPAAQMRTFDRLVPVFRIVDRILFRSVGLSLVMAGRKK
jgi:SAM-dependent methyltransferase